MMESTLFLGQLFGAYLLVMGVVLLAKEAEMRKMMMRIVKNRIALFMGGVIAFILGLVLVLYHNVWDTDLAMVISLIAWLVLLKGLCLIFLPQDWVMDQTKRFNKTVWISFFGLINVALGLYITSSVLLVM